MKCWPINIINEILHRMICILSWKVVYFLCAVLLYLQAGYQNDHFLTSVAVIQAIRVSFGASLSIFRHFVGVCGLCRCRYFCPNMPIHFLNCVPTQGRRHRGDAGDIVPSSFKTGGDYPLHFWARKSIKIKRKIFLNVNLVSGRKIVGEIRRVFSFWWGLPSLAFWPVPPPVENPWRRPCTYPRMETSRNGADDHCFPDWYDSRHFSLNCTLSNTRQSVATGFRLEGTGQMDSQG